MDYRDLAKINENKEMIIKHMAFAVKKVDNSLNEWKGLLSVSSKIEPVVWEKAKTRVAVFYIGGIEFQLCESLEIEGRFNRWIKKYGEGLHHICYEVKDIEKILNHSKNNGAKLRICEACNVYGSHPHPEGFVAFLDNESSGIEIEFMQVYSPEELKKYQIKGV
tara:strand:- start:297 stop:788 length:492 start_codon:yes stop_codon:yes gene_type:complete